MVRFDSPAEAGGLEWELCFEFDLPGDSHHAGAIEAVLVSTDGKRAPLGESSLDRRGEAVVCQIGRLLVAGEGPPPQSWEGVELRSSRPLTIRGLRGGPRRDG